MKLKSIILTALTILNLATATKAQLPSYVPSNGLVGWWPFNGTANDESGNGNNGTVNNVNLTTDRFNLTNSAYLFNDFNSYIQLPSLTFNQYTFSCWIYDHDIQDTSSIFTTSNSYPQDYFYHEISYGYIYSQYKIPLTFPYGNGYAIAEPYNSLDSSWHFIAISYDGLTINHYLDGSLINTGSPGVAGILNNTGMKYISNPYTSFDGKIDNFGLWNRALTQQEITDLFNAANCGNNTTITPQTNSLTTGSTAEFTATTSDPNPSYIWQSDLGQGFQTLNNFGNYTGANSPTLNIANVQLPNHTQPIRIITASGNCVDTSNVALINIFDTCINNLTVYDTLLTTVTDTLIINATITGLNPPTNQNTLKVFPNPAHTHITINYGNFNSMNGYTLKIVNSVGQTVLTTTINQQTSYIDLSTWTGSGIYYVQIIDTQNNTIENRKIVIL